MGEACSTGRRDGRPATRGSLGDWSRDGRAEEGTGVGEAWAARARHERACAAGVGDRSAARKRRRKREMTGGGHTSARKKRKRGSRPGRAGPKGDGGLHGRFQGKGGRKEGGEGDGPAWRL